MKKLALLVYPECSLQEMMNLARLFRWDFDAETEAVSTGSAPVKSEEGIWVQPRKTTDEFRKEDYLCLVLPGCSDFTEVAKDKKLIAFLESFQRDEDFPIGAICSGPAPLVVAGNIVTAGGSNFNGFAVAMARQLGLECPDRISAAIWTTGRGRITSGIFRKRRRRRPRPPLRSCKSAVLPPRLKRSPKCGMIPR